jgi:hypothetical protein
VFYNQQRRQGRQTPASAKQEHGGPTMQPRMTLGTLSVIVILIVTMRQSMTSTREVLEQVQTSVATPPQSPENQQINAKFLKQLSEQIKGRENELATNVFKNVQILKTVSASVFLQIMNGGYSRALGVQCTHCHVESEFSSDEKRPKRAAREMATMHTMINQQLAKMQNLDSPSDQRSMSCSTCHRGQIKAPRQ